MFLFLDFRTFFKISILWRDLVFVVPVFNLAVLRARSDCGSQEFVKSARGSPSLGRLDSDQKVICES